MDGRARVPRCLHCLGPGLLASAGCLVVSPGSDRELLVERQSRDEIGDALRLLRRLVLRQHQMSLHPGRIGSGYVTMPAATGAAAQPPTRPSSARQAQPSSHSRQQCASRQRRSSASAWTGSRSGRRPATSDTSPPWSGSAVRFAARPRALPTGTPIGTGLPRAQGPLGHHRRRHPAAQQPSEPHGVRRRHAGRRVLILVKDLHIRVLTDTGELLRELTLDPSRDCQLQPKP